MWHHLTDADGMLHSCCSNVLFGITCIERSPCN